MTWARLIESEANLDPELKAMAVSHVAPPGFINFHLHDEALHQKSSKGARELVRLKPNEDPSAFHAVPIGYFESCFGEKHGTPRQGAIASAARGCLTLRPELNADALFGLEEYSHVWLIFVFHANTNLKDHANFKAKIRPPRLQGQKAGVFATRSPHRVNPIGLSVAKLEKIVDATLFFSGIDLINGTPVLDIKPYHPCDCVSNYAIPSWMQAAPPTMLNVRWRPQAEAELSEAVPNLRFFDTFGQIKLAIDQSLSQDPRTLSSKKIQVWPVGVYDRQY